MEEEFNIVKALENLIVQDTECRICTHRWRAVVSTMDDTDNLPCPNCDSLSGEPFEPPSYN